VNNNLSVESFVQTYLEEIGTKPQARFVSESLLREQVTGLADTMANGIPLFARLNLTIDHSSLLSFAKELESFLFLNSCENVHSTISCLSSPQNSSNPISYFAQRVLKGDGSYISTLSKTHNIPLDILAFFGVYLVRPIRQQVRKILETEHAFSQWRLGYCPVCGLWPRMSRIEPEYGRRFLWCIGCNGEWQFPRLSCPFCFEKSQDKLGYLIVEDWSNYRIYTCDNCHRYLKTRDERQPARIKADNFDIEYLSTSTLDKAATQEKYIMDFVVSSAFDMKDNESARAYKERALS